MRVPELTPNDALVSCERALRQLYAKAYEDAYGDGWVELVEPDAQLRAKWNRARERERDNRGTRGVTSIPETDLDYAEFKDLVRIAAAHWEPLRPALGPEDEVLPLLRRFEWLRHTVAHSRQPLAFERDLLSGIAGQIRNQVTQFMTEVDPSGDHYARIESVTDSFGRSSAGRPDAALGVPVSGARPRVQVGDTVTFECVGVDPQERELMWTALVGGLAQVATSIGERSEVVWHVAAEHVGQSTMIAIRLASAGPYRRHGAGTWDDAVMFSFEVLPPAPRGAPNAA